MKDGCIDIALVRFLGGWGSSLHQSKPGLGDAYTVGHLAGQDTAAEDLKSRTDEVIFLLSCSRMMYGREMPSYLRPVFVLDPRGRSEDPRQYILFAWCASVVFAPVLRSMGLHLRVICADPIFFTRNVIEHGSSGVKICLYDHLSVSPAVAVGMDAPWKGRVQGPLSI